MGTTTQPLVACPKCQGPTWDNRATKKNPSAPDFKCRDRSCDGVIWPPRQPKQGGNGQPPVQQKPVAAPEAYVGNLPGDPAVGPFDGIAQRYEETLRHVIKNVVPIFTQAGIVVDAKTIASIAAHLNITRQQRGV
jgi:hypothetical protein